jgi:hypothetical protein
METWNNLVPGLVPDVKARYRRDGRESFLGQYLAGTLLRDIYLTRPWPEKLRVTHRLLETVRDVWLATASAARPRVDYVRQIMDRLPELYALHPELEVLRRGRTRVFDIVHPSLRELLDRAAAIEGRLAPPLSVRIHGDFNTNNIIYDARRDRVHFIDVHRSRPGDYAQDIGVFLVSNLRYPAGRAHRRRFERLNGIIVTSRESRPAHR